MAERLKALDCGSSKGHAHGFLQGFESLPLRTPKIESLIPIIAKRVQV